MTTSKTLTCIGMCLLALSTMNALAAERLLQTEIDKQLFDLVKAGKYTEAYGLWSKTQQLDR